MHVTRDFDILLTDALGGVDHDEHHIRAAYRHKRADHAVAFDGFIVYAALAADASGIDQNVFSAFMLKRRVDRIARGAGNIAHNAALRAKQCV
ncbi:hypothetical protein SDC9_177421 [bioreactor metagenome]|uniref:Uncharacterized protein n=1 Tax=bioreactor metagenome TaxID=1076179 RepID=A0A645H0X7_9ZZZZ